MYSNGSNDSAVQDRTGQYSNGSNGKIKNPVCLLPLFDKLFFTSFHSQYFYQQNTIWTQGIMHKPVTANSVHQFN